MNSLVLKAKRILAGDFDPTTTRCAMVLTVILLACLAIFSGFGFKMHSTFQSIIPQLPG